ncbi:MAG: hypothetical protein AAFR97_08070 [Bacteroidota bacterium]
MKLKLSVKAAIAKALRVDHKRIADTEIQDKGLLVKVHPISGQRGQNFPNNEQLVRWEILLSEYREKRRKKGLKLYEGEAVSQDFADPAIFWVQSGDCYEVTVAEQQVSCDCKDYQHAKAAFGEYTICGHGYAVLNCLGYSTLSDFLKGKQTMEPVMFLDSQVSDPAAELEMVS